MGWPVGSVFRLVGPSLWRAGRRQDPAEMRGEVLPLCKGNGGLRAGRASGRPWSARLRGTKEKPTGCGLKFRHWTWWLGVPCGGLSSNGTRQKERVYGRGITAEWVKWTQTRPPLRSWGACPVVPSRTSSSRGTECTPEARSCHCLASRNRALCPESRPQSFRWPHAPKDLKNGCKLSPQCLSFRQSRWAMGWPCPSM